MHQRRRAFDSLYVTDDFILTHNTLADAFIILDEAQNTTSEQMKMFLTRIGFGSKAVITGDVTQIDLPSGRKSGLVEAQRVVSRIEGIEFVEFTDQDVVRHQLVQMIIRAYDEQQQEDQHLSGWSRCSTGSGGGRLTAGGWRGWRARRSTGRGGRRRRSP